MTERKKENEKVRVHDTEEERMAERREGMIETEIEWHSEREGMTQRKKEIKKEHNDIEREKIKERE